MRSRTKPDMSRNVADRIDVPDEHIPAGPAIRSLAFSLSGGAILLVAAVAAFAPI
jgi:hypothetical protein